MRSPELTGGRHDQHCRWVTRLLEQGGVEGQFDEKMNSLGVPSVKIVSGSEVPAMSAPPRMPCCEWLDISEPRSVTPIYVISEPRVLAPTS